MALVRTIGWFGSDIWDAVTSVASDAWDVLPGSEIVGGALSGFGAITDRWYGEYCGLPLLASVFGVYGIGALALARANQWTSLAGGFAFLAIAVLFCARWAQVGGVRRAAQNQVDVRTDTVAHGED